MDWFVVSRTSENILILGYTEIFTSYSDQDVGNTGHTGSC